MRVLIVGGGIGGLTLGLMLHRAGIRCAVREAVPELRPVGVGINALPHSIKELAALDLLPALDRTGIRTRHLTYANHLGQEIWSESRGMFGGYDVPQFSIHRGQLQVLLWRALAERVPAEDLRTGCRLVSFEQDAAGVRATFKSPDGTQVEEEADILIGADGIHSAVRALLHPDEPALRWSGLTMWRGAADWPLFDGGDSMVIAGNGRATVVLYPIARGGAEDTRLTNWVVVTRRAEPGTDGAPPESWSTHGSLDDIKPLLADFDFPYTDLHQLVEKTPDVLEFSLFDREPLPWWTKGRVTLLGDAAHPMYPFGSNGSAQAVLDAKCLAGLLSAADAPGTVLEAYERERLPATAAIVRSNRTRGPEAVINVVAERAPHGFKDLHDVISQQEIDEIVHGYATLAGFAQTPAATSADSTSDVLP